MTASLDSLVAEVRKKLVTPCPELYNRAMVDLFHAADQEIIKKEDWFIIKWLEFTENNTEKSAKMISKCLTWVKEESIAHHPPNYYPNEFYTLGTIFPYENDLNGRPVVHIRYRLFLNLPSFVKQFEQFTLNVFYQLLTTEKKGYTIVIDFRETKLSNFNNEVLRSILKSWVEYFQPFVKQVIIVELSWGMNMIWTLFKTILPKWASDSIIRIESHEIFNYVDAKNLPPYLGGECQRPFCGDVMKVDNSPDLVEFMIKAGVSKKDIISGYHKYLAVYQAENVEFNPKMELLDALKDD